MRFSGSAVLAALACQAATAPILAQRAVSLVRVNSVQVVGREAELGAIAMTRVGPQGNVYAADYLNARVVAFSPEGRLLWTSGRKGRGPGEFQLPYRVDPRPDGGLLVLDAGTSEVTLLNARGRFTARYRLPFRFDQPDAIVGLPDGHLVISGTTFAEPRARRYGIHRFRVSGAELKYVGSFGPLPRVRNPLVLQSWGAGSATRAANGDLLYALRIPFEVHRFDPAGRPREVVRYPFRTRGTPDDAETVVVTEKETTYSSTDADVERPGAAFELPGGLLVVTRSSRDTRHWDFFRGGRYLGSQRIERDWGGVAGYDPARGFLWMAGTLDDEPVLRRLSITVAVPPSTRARE
ncbi:MAG TPA: hypothetical protein VF746_03700 [Longimicrobium sp.]|jgi:hypothetical protein